MLTQSNASSVAGQSPTDLVLERLPSGELAWLRLNPHAVHIVEDQYAPLPDDARFDITEAGRRAVAIERLFGPWPPVAEACA